MNFKEAKEIAKSRGHKVTGIKKDANGVSSFFIDDIKVFNGNDSSNHLWSHSKSETVTTKYGDTYLKDQRYKAAIIIFVIDNVIGEAV